MNNVKYLKRILEKYENNNPLDLQEIIEKYTDLNFKRIWNNYATTCPFHEEDTPSFFVNQEKYILKCFWCWRTSKSVLYFLFDYVFKRDFWKFFDFLKKSKIVWEDIFSKEYLWQLITLETELDLYLEKRLRFDNKEVSVINEKIMENLKDKVDEYYIN